MNRRCLLEACLNRTDPMNKPQRLPHRSKGLPAQPSEVVELGEYTFKIADLPQEFDQIHRLLHRTFVVEIARYDDPGTDYLVDKFHERNVYVIALRNGYVCGMIAVDRWRRRTGTLHQSFDTV